jgi:hypothetical protein
MVSPEAPIVEFVQRELVSNPCFSLHVMATSNGDAMRLFVCRDREHPDSCLLPMPRSCRNHAATSKHVTTEVQHVATRRRVERVLVPAFFRDPTLISAAGGLMAEREWLFDNKNVLDFIVVRDATSHMRTPNRDWAVVRRYARSEPPYATQTTSPPRSAGRRRPGTHMAWSWFSTA